MGKAQPVPDDKQPDLIISAEEFGVASWRDGPPGSDVPVSQVHIHYTVEELPGIFFAIRLKSRAVCDDLIAALKAHRDEVWPEDSSGNE